MAKPEKVRSSGAALTVDGIQLKRVQSLSTDIDITRDQVLELANSGVVQFVEQSPVITISVDTNEYGTVDNLVLLAGKLITATSVSNTDDAREGYFAHKVKLKNASQITEQDMLDGYATLAVPILEDQSSTTVARTMIIPRAAITGYALNYDVGGIATENFTLQANDKYWYFNDWRDVRVFKLTNLHIGHTVAAGDQSEYMMQDNAGAYNDGTAQAFVFLASAIAASTDCQSGDYGDGTNIDNMEAVALIVNNVVFRSTAGGNGPWHFDVDPDLNGGTVHMGIDGNLPGGFSTPYAREGDDVWLIFNSETNQTWPGNADTDSSNPGYALVSTAGSYGGASKGFMTGYLFNLGGPSGETTTADAGKTLRIQTIAIDLSFTTENLDELGTFQSYGVVKQTPVPVNVTVTANDSDLEAWGRTSEKEFNTEKELYTELFTGRNAVHIDVFKDKTKTLLLKQVSSTSMSVVGESHAVSVGGQASQEFTFTCDNVTITGTGIEP